MEFTADGYPFPTEFQRHSDYGSTAELVIDKIYKQIHSHATGNVTSLLHYHTYIFLVLSLKVLSY